MPVKTFGQAVKVPMRLLAVITFLVMVIVTIRIMMMMMMTTTTLLLVGAIQFVLMRMAFVLEPESLVLLLVTRLYHQ